MMHFEDMSSFIDMGGYGLFVWLSFGAAVLSIVAVWLNSFLTKQRMFKQVLQEQARQQRIQAAQANKDVNKQSVVQEK